MMMGSSRAPEVAVDEAHEIIENEMIEDSETDTEERTEIVCIDDNEDSQSPGENEDEVVSESENNEEYNPKSGSSITRNDDEDTNDSTYITDESNVRNTLIHQNSVMEAESDVEIDEVPTVDSDNEVNEVELGSDNEVETVQDSSEEDNSSDDEDNETDVDKEDAVVRSASKKSDAVEVLEVEEMQENSHFETSSNIIQIPKETSLGQEENDVSVDAMIETLIENKAIESEIETISITSIEDLDVKSLESLLQAQAPTEQTTETEILKSGDSTVVTSNENVSQHRAIEEVTSIDADVTIPNTIEVCTEKNDSNLDNSASCSTAVEENDTLIQDLETSLNQVSDLVTRSISPEVDNSVTVESATVKELENISKEEDVVSEIDMGDVIDPDKSGAETTIKPRTVSEEISKLEFNNVGWVDSSSDSPTATSTDKLESPLKVENEPNGSSVQVQNRSKLIQHTFAEPDSPSRSEEEVSLPCTSEFKVRHENSLEGAVSSSVSEVSGEDKESSNNKTDLFIKKRFDSADPVDDNATDEMNSQHGYVLKTLTKAETTNIMMDTSKSSPSEQEGTVSDREDQTDDDYDEVASRPSSGYLPTSPQTELPFPSDSRSSPLCYPLSPVSGMKRESIMSLLSNKILEPQRPQEILDHKSNVHSTVDLEKMVGVELLCRGTELTSSNLVLEELGISELKSSTVSVDMQHKNNNANFLDLNNNQIPQETVPKKKVEKLVVDKVEQTLRAWDRDIAVDKWGPTPNRSREENSRIHADTLQSWQSQNKRITELSDAPMKKKRSYFDRSTPSKLEPKIATEVASDPIEDNIEQPDFNVTNKSSKSDNCRRKLVFDSPDLQLSVTGSQFSSNPNIEKGKLNLLESDSDACDQLKTQDKEADRDSIELNTPPKITTEMTAIAQENIIRDAGMPEKSLSRDELSYKSNTLENIPGVPFNHEAYLAYMTFNQINSIPRSPNSRFSDINNNLPQNMSSKFLTQNIPSNQSGPSILNKFWWTSYMAQMERINYLWGENSTSFQASHHQANVQQTLNPSINTELNASSHQRSISATQESSDRIDKAIDAWVYAAKNNDKTTRDAAHKEFLSSVSSAASASFPKKNVINNQDIHKSKDNTVDNTSNIESKKRSHKYLEEETEERAVAIGIEGDIELTKEELEALKKVKESIAKRLKLEASNFSNPLSLLVSEKENEQNLEKSTVTA